MRDLIIKVTKFGGDEKEVQTPRFAHQDWSNKRLLKIELSQFSPISDLRTINLSNNRIRTVNLSPVSTFSLAKNSGYPVTAQLILRSSDPAERAL